MPRAAHHPRQSQLLKDSIRKLTAFHILGKKALELWHRAPGVNACGVVAQHAQQLSCSRSHVHAARLFAEAIDDAELAWFLERMRQHGRRVSMCHVRTLATVPDKKKRDEYTRRLMKEGWSVRQLQAEIRKAYPKRGRGGRPFTMPSDGAELMRQLREMCEKWQRYDESFALARNQPAAAARTELPDTVERAYKKVLRAVENLDEIIQGELTSRKRPRRQ